MNIHLRKFSILFFIFEGQIARLHRQSQRNFIKTKITQKEPFCVRNRLLKVINFKS